MFVKCEECHAHQRPRGSFSGFMDLTVASSWRYKCFLRPLSSAEAPMLVSLSWNVATSLWVTRARKVYTYTLLWDTQYRCLDLLQVDLLASGASLFSPTAGDEVARGPWELLWMVQAHRPVFGSVKLAPINYEKSFVPRLMKSDEGLFWKSISLFWGPV